MSGRILIVEDDRSMGEMLEADLRLRGFATVWCPTAEEALAQWQHDDFDVVLTDLKLPGLQGLDLCERLVAEASEHVLRFDWDDIAQRTRATYERVPGRRRRVRAAAASHAQGGLRR